MVIVLGDHTGIIDPRASIKYMLQYQIKLSDEKKAMYMYSTIFINISRAKIFTFFFFSSAIIENLFKMPTFVLLNYP